MRTPEIGKDELFHQYITLGKNRNMISEEFGIPTQRVGVLLQKYGIKRYSVCKDGRTNHPLYCVWSGMKERCNNKNATNYKWYGGAGITVCEEWTEFGSFCEWAETHGWQPGLTIDRIDIKKGYSPANCRFVTARQQFRNRRSNVSITVDGMTKLQCEWEEYLGLKNKRIAKWKMQRGIDYAISRIRDEIKQKSPRSAEEENED